MAALMMSCCSIYWHYVCCQSFLSGIFGASETVCRWKSRLCLFSPTWWFRLVWVPEGCQVQSPQQRQILPQQPCLSSAKSTPPRLFFLSLLAKIIAELVLIHTEMFFIVYFSFWIRWNVYDCMLNFNLKCATVISDFTFTLSFSFSINLFLCLW